MSKAAESRTILKVAAAVTRLVPRYVHFDKQCELWIVSTFSLFAKINEVFFNHVSPDVESQLKEEIRRRWSVIRSIVLTHALTHAPTHAPAWILHRSAARGDRHNVVISSWSFSLMLSFYVVFLFSNKIICFIFNKVGVNWYILAFAFALKCADLHLNPSL